MRCFADQLQQPHLTPTRRSPSGAPATRRNMKLPSVRINAEQIFYMQQRGLSEGQAMSLAVNGFVNDLVSQFPMEYSVELKRADRSGDGGIPVG